MRIVTVVDTMQQDRSIANTSRAAFDVLHERHRQRHVEGWSDKHDDEHDGGSLAAAACCYSLAAADLQNPHSQGDGQFDRTNPPPMWPMDWDTSWWKPGDPRRMLVKAAALLLAEIERLDRAQGRKNV